VVTFTARPLYTQGKSPQYPLDRRPEYGIEEKNSQPGIEPISSDRPAGSQLFIVLAFINRNSAIR